MSWPAQPAAASPTPAGAEPSVFPVGSVGPVGPAPAETCPLCGSPLQTDQDWCLYCGAAAHTRLSATPNWKAPLAVAIVVAALFLGVLAAALVKLAHGPGPAPPAATTVITAPSAAGTTTPGTTTPGATTPGTTTPGTTTPGTGATGTGATGTGATGTGATGSRGGTTTPGAAATGTSGPTSPAR